MLVGLTFVLVFVFLLYSISQIKDLQLEQEYNLVRDLALTLQEEVNLAITVDDGYFRNLTIPDKLETYNFEINRTENILSVETEKAFFTVKVPFFEGNFTKGLNRIRKKNDIVYINE